MRYKYKKWWYRYWKPDGFLVDKLVFDLSAENEINEATTKKLGKELLEKYFIKVEE